MRSAHWMMAASVAFSAAGGAWAIQGEGLIPPKDTPWPRWQARLALGTTAPLYRADPLSADSGRFALSGATLLGDYYFTRSLPRLGDNGGFRATSGVFLGHPSHSLLSTTPGARLGGRAFSIDQRTVGGLRLPVHGEAAPDAGATPYVGIGYTGLPSKGGWGFSADFGLVATSPGSAVKLGRMVSGNDSVDDALREMRLSPLLQLGVSYSF